MLSLFTFRNVLPIMLIAALAFSCGGSDNEDDQPQPGPTEYSDAGTATFTAIDLGSGDTSTFTGTISTEGFSDIPYGPDEKNFDRYDVLVKDGNSWTRQRGLGFLPMTQTRAVLNTRTMVPILIWTDGWNRVSWTSQLATRILAMVQLQIRATFQSQ